MRTTCSLYANKRDENEKEYTLLSFSFEEKREEN